MSNYTKSTNFATKDALASGNPLKIVKGTEIDTEFNNIATAIATKADLASPTFTGTVTLPNATYAISILGNAATATTATTATSATTATNATKVATTNFTIEESGGKLVFKYGSTVIGSMTSAGVFTALSDVVGGGTP